MDSVSGNNSGIDFPFSALPRLEQSTVPLPRESSDYLAQSYDNRRRVSDMAKTLNAKLGYLKDRISYTSFLSSNFSWQVKTAASSDTAVTLARASRESPEESWSLEIETPAIAKAARSRQLAAGQVSDLATGSYSFTLSAGGTAFTIDLSIENEADDPLTNRALLRRVERAVNSRGAGVTARLEDRQVRDYNPFREDAVKKVSYLEIVTDEPGADAGFALADVSGSLISDLALDRTVRFGRDSRYRVNGTSFSSEANQVAVGENTLDVALLAGTRDEANARITVKGGTASLGRELEAVMADYNDFIQWIDDNASVISPGLKKALFKDIPSLVLENRTVSFSSDGTADHSGLMAAAPHALDRTGFKPGLNLDVPDSLDRSLDDLGLTLTPEGRLEIDSDFSMKLAADLEKAYQSLAGEEGFLTRVYQNMTRIEQQQSSNFVFSLNSILSYNPQGTGARGIYRDNSSAIINYFA